MMPLDIAIEVLKNQNIRISNKEPHETDKEHVLIEFIDKAINKPFASVLLFVPKDDATNYSSCILEIKPHYQYTEKHYEFIKGFDAIDSIHKYIKKRTLIESFVDILK